MQHKQDMVLRKNLSTFKLSHPNDIACRPKSLRRIVDVTQSLPAYALNKHQKRLIAGDDFKFPKQKVKETKHQHHSISDLLI